jgi:hypothetical protein
MLINQNHAAGEENGSIMVGMFVCLYLASKKPSEREFFVPAGTDLGVKLLISFRIFVHCQRLIARNVADGFLLFSLADTF